MMYRQGKTITSTSTEVDRFKSAVRRVITSQEVRGEQWRTGPRRKVLVRIVRLIDRHARTGSFTAREQHYRFQPMIIVRRVKQILQNESSVVWQLLTKAHKAARLEWASDMVALRRDTGAKWCLATRAVYIRWIRWSICPLERHPSSLPLPPHPPKRRWGSNHLGLLFLPRKVSFGLHTGQHRLVTALLRSGDDIPPICIRAMPPRLNFPSVYCLLSH